MSKHRATPRHNGAHLAPRRRPLAWLAGLAVLLTSFVVAVPALLLAQDPPDRDDADRDAAVSPPSTSAVPSPTHASGQPDGEVAVGRHRSPTPPKRTPPAPRVPERGPGTFQVAAAPIGRAHVCTPVTNAHLVCRLLLETTKQTNKDIKK